MSRTLRLSLETRRFSCLRKKRRISLICSVSYVLRPVALQWSWESPSPLINADWCLLTQTSMASLGAGILTQVPYHCHMQGKQYKPPRHKKYLTKIPKYSNAKIYLTKIPRKFTTKIPHIGKCPGTPMFYTTLADESASLISFSSVGRSRLVNESASLISFWSVGGSWLADESASFMRLFVGWSREADASASLFKVIVYYDHVWNIVDFINPYCLISIKIQG